MRTLHLVTRRLSRLAGVLFVICAGAVSPAAAQTPPDRYAVLVEGASGGVEAQRRWLDSLATLLRGPFGFDPAHVIVLSEQPKAGEQASNAINVKAALQRLAGQTKDADQVFVVMIGHGGGDGADAKFNLVGPDLTVVDWSALLSPIKGHMAVIDTTGGSFPYLKGLSVPGRVVITATATFAQRYDTVFPEAFIQALSTSAADADKNGRISLLEAFTYASSLVAKHYEQQGLLSTEHAVFNDTGDGSPQDKFVPGATAGTVASLTYLDAVAAPKSSDPAVQALLVRQQTLTQQVDDLRRRRPTMSQEQFDQEFETLIVDLALVSRDVRRRTGG